MRKKKPKIIVVVGPTASGKSDLAVHLAKKYNGEVISADSRQVYTGLNIGTGKITKKEMRGIPHHLLSVVSPKKTFTAKLFKQKAQEVIEDILRREKLPIVAGGTGFYIDVLLGSISIPVVPPNETLRKKLEKQSVKTLFKKLKKLDPVRVKTIDRQNKRRLIRAVEIATVLGTVPRPKRVAFPYTTLKIGINIENTILKQRIKKRLLVRLRAGMIAEAKRLHAKGLSWKRMEELGLEYRFCAQYLKGQTFSRRAIPPQSPTLEKEEMIEQLNTAIWHYAKRQKRWFKRDKEIKWFKPNKIKKIENAVKAFLKTSYGTRF